MTAQPLDGLRVLELADGPSGGFCGRQFAAWGADVVMLEPPGGGPLRQAAPRWTKGGARGSAAFDMLACGKRSVPLSDAAALLAAADVLVCDAPAGALAGRLGRDAADLRRANPSLVVVTLSAFGDPDGPTAGIAELEAISGYLSLNGPAAGVPLASPANIMAHAIGASAFAGAVAALIGRERTGAGDHVAVSGLETIASFVMWLREQHQDAPTARDGGTPEGARLIRCADGHVSVAPAVAPHLPVYREVLEVPDSVDLERLAEGGRLEAADRVAAALAPYAARLGVEEVFLSLQVRGVACGKVQSLAEVLDDRQLEDRAFFRPLAHPAAGPLPLAGRPSLMTDSAPIPPTPAPASTDAASLGWTPVARASAPDGRPPLAGMRVLDLTQAWIGPMAAVALADLGAEVIKVEGVTRPDIWRFLGQAPGESTAAENRSWYFNGANRSKLGLGLDLSQPAGADVFRRMVADADIVLENFTPKVMARFGLDYAQLGAVRPGLIMTSFSGFGAFGPHAGFKANGASIEALAGWDALHRDEAGRPVLMGGYPADPICGLQMIACTLVALYRRLRTGRGAHVEGSMLEAAGGYIGDALLAEALAQAGATIENDPPPTVRSTGAGTWAVGGEPVASTWEALSDPRLASWFVPLTSAGLGPGRHAGRLWRFADAAAPTATPPPRLGEHTRAVLAQWLTPDEIERLIADGVAGSLD
ncbi:CoA transferase [Phenylobacterium sp.]|uniref:CoA transferase n=1 Tax=Phenylobacterium sp. TaxID=1871053 RepID=UPI0025CE494A|nr:CoA transferase [Phenylobacterium sp.]MBX3484840.1 CoA transferase [Phenylobacterium sp.]MCW5759185.1 CoA transferase [Phenylobacterium sp.]